MLKCVCHRQCNESCVVHGISQAANVEEQTASENSVSNSDSLRTSITISTSTVNIIAMKMQNSCAVEETRVSSSEVSHSLPQMPQEPKQWECCGSGCVPCVFDLYEQELKLWKRECECLTNGLQNLHVSPDNVSIIAALSLCEIWKL